MEYRQSYISEEIENQVEDEANLYIFSEGDVRLEVLAGKFLGVQIFKDGCPGVKIDIRGLAWTAEKYQKKIERMQELCFWAYDAMSKEFGEYLPLLKSLYLPLSAVKEILPYEAYSGPSFDPETGTMEKATMVSEEELRLLDEAVRGEIPNAVVTECPDQPDLTGYHEFMAALEHEPGKKDIEPAEIGKTEGKYGQYVLF